MRIFKSNKGYTLIELLAVMIIMITVGLIIATILVSSLRGSNKTNTIESIRQNGNYTILQISKMLEFAQSFQGVSNDDINYLPNCSSPATQYKYIKITSFDNQPTTFSCRANDIASNGASLINTNEVSLGPCSFTCSRNLSLPPTIGIAFTLLQKSTSSFFEKQATIDFQTSVILRNLNK